MMHFINRIVDYVLYSNLFIGACAICMAMTYNAFDYTNPHSHVLLAFIFFSTTAGYSILKLRPFTQKNSGSNLSEYSQWVNGNVVPAYATLVSSFIISVLLFFNLTWIEKKVVFLSAGITVMYSLPLLKKFALREAGLFKTIYVAAVWTLTTGILPSIDTFEAGASLSIPAVIQNFLFVFPLCIAYDLKDVKEDEAAGILTLPLAIGWPKTKLLAILIVILSVAVQVVQTYSTLPHQNYLHSALQLIPELCCIAVISNISIKTSEKYFLGILDGLMIFQFLFLNCLLKG